MFQENLTNHMLVVPALAAVFTRLNRGRIDNNNTLRKAKCFSLVHSFYSRCTFSVLQQIDQIVSVVLSTLRKASDLCILFVSAVKIGDSYFAPSKALT